MKFKDFVGIDVLKHTLDVFILNVKVHKQFKNERLGFQQLEQWVQRQKSGEPGCQPTDEKVVASSGYLCNTYRYGDQNVLSAQAGRREKQDDSHQYCPKQALGQSLCRR